MISCVLEGAAKTFMSSLLRDALFDDFDVRVVEIFLDVHITIDCQTAAADDAQKPAFAAWSRMKPLVYEIIKQGARPRQMKIVFSHRDPAQVHENAAALFLNVMYEADAVVFTTGAAQRNFALDKAMDRQWDDFVQQFFSDAQVRVAQRV